MSNAQRRQYDRRRKLLAQDKQHRPPRKQIVKPAPAAEQLELRLTRFVYRPEMLDKIGLSYATIWNLMRRGEFPASHEVDDQVAWYEDELLAWMKTRPVRQLNGGNASSTMGRAGSSSRRTSPGRT